jgi:hypothetical protein
MTSINQTAPQANALHKGRSRAVLAARLAAIRAQIQAVVSAPYAYGRLNGPHRRQRDFDILQGLAADIYSRLVAEMEAGQ